MAARAWRDHAWLAVFSLALFALSSAPFVYGTYSAPSGRVFMGIVSDVPDTAQYFAWMRAHQEAMVVANWMTPEPNDPAFFNLLWLVLGRLSLWTGLSFALALQCLRLCACLAFSFVLFWWYGLLAESRRERWLASVLVLTGGGIGWVWVIEKYVARRADMLFPLDVQVAEPNAFLSLIGYPHFLVAAALVLGVLGLSLLGTIQQRIGPFAVAALLAFILGLQHAYDLITIYAVLGAFVLLRWWGEQRFPLWEAAGVALIGAVSSPPAAYFAYLTSRNPIWRQVLAQFDNAGVFTPNPLHLLIVLGPQLALAALLLPELLRRKQPADLLLLAWTVIGFGLLYIPADFQIHMLNPYQVPLAILAVRRLLRYVTQAGPKARIRRYAAPALLALASVVNIYLLGWRMIDLARHDPPYYLARDETDAIAWLNRQPGHDVVLAGESIGQYLPALAGKRAVLAHWAQTVDYYAKRDGVARVFAPGTPAAERDAFLQRFDVTFLVAGQAEIDAGAAAALDASGYTRVFSAPRAIVYRVGERHSSP
jgi:hypothetical protein